MNARDIIKLAAQLYVYDALKKKITILTNIQKGKDINVDIFLPKVTDVTVSDFAKYLQKAIESQPATIEEYDMYIEMLCENCLTEILDKKITAIKPKKIE